MHRVKEGISLGFNLWEEMVLDFIEKGKYLNSMKI
jgi:hypothetical protein